MNETYLAIAKEAKSVLEYAELLGRDLFPEFNHHYISDSFMNDYPLLSFTINISPSLQYSSSTILYLIKEHYSTFIDTFLETLSAL